MKKLIQIKLKFSDKIVFEGKYESIKNCLEDATIKNVDLRGADLGGANLWGANLWGADLREADLSGANLREADLQNVKLYGKGGTTRIKKSDIDNFLKALGVIVE